MRCSGSPRSAAPSSATCRSPTPTRCSPRRSRRAAGRARTGARSPPGASRQAGRTIRGEDAIGFLQDRLHASVSSCTRCSRSGAGCCDAGCSTRPAGWAGSWAGCTRRSTPWKLASDAVARGNLKVFAEIGYEFARYLVGGRVRRRGAAVAGGVRGYDEALADRRPQAPCRAACCTRTCASACTSRPACNPRSPRRSTRRTSPPRRSGGCSAGPRVRGWRAWSASSRCPSKAPSPAFRAR